MPVVQLGLVHVLSDCELLSFLTYSYSIIYIFGTIAVERYYIFNFHFETVKGLLPNIVMKKRGIWSVGWKTTARWYSVSKTL